MSCPRVSGRFCILPLGSAVVHMPLHKRSRRSGDQDIEYERPFKSKKQRDCMFNELMLTSCSEHQFVANAIPLLKFERGLMFNVLIVRRLRPFGLWRIWMSRQTMRTGLEEASELIAAPTTTSSREIGELTWQPKNSSLIRRRRRIATAASRRGWTFIRSAGCVFRLGGAVPHLWRRRNLQESQRTWRQSRSPWPHYSRSSRQS